MPCSICCVCCSSSFVPRSAKHPLQCFDITDYNKSGFICLHDCLTQGRAERQAGGRSEWRVDRTTVSGANDALSMAFISLLRQLQLRLQRRLSHVNLQFNLFIDYVIQALPPAAASIFMHNTCVCVGVSRVSLSVCVSVCHLHANLCCAARRACPSWVCVWD